MSRVLCIYINTEPLIDLHSLFLSVVTCTYTDWSHDTLVNPQCDFGHCGLHDIPAC